MAKGKEEKYFFGEKPDGSTELAKDGKTSLTVVWTECYKSARQKVLDELCKDNKLNTSDFWTLKREVGEEMQYAGLIISHNGCLKLNSLAPKEKQFKPSCVEIDKQGYNNSLVLFYKDDKAGIFEIGEVSRSNNSFSYPYCVAFKRCFDRVVLKLNNIFLAIHSESEADDFAQSKAKPNQPVLEPVKTNNSNVIVRSNDNNTKTTDVKAKAPIQNNEQEIEIIPVNPATDNAPTPVATTEINAKKQELVKKAMTLLDITGKLDDVLEYYSISRLSELKEENLEFVIKRQESQISKKTKKIDALENALAALNEDEKDFAPAQPMQKSPAKAKAPTQNAQAEKPQQTTAKKEDELTLENMLFEVADNAPSELKAHIGVKLVDLPNEVLNALTARKNAQPRRFCNPTVLAGLDAIALKRKK